MKTGAAFWGSFLISVGVLQLFATFGVILPRIGAVMKLWPILLIVLGLSFMIRAPRIRLVLAVLTGLLAGLWIMGMCEHGGTIEDSTAFDIDFSLHS